MDRSIIIALLARKMAGEATPVELEQLEELMARFPDSVYYDEILKEIWQQSDTDDALKAQTDHALMQHLAKFKHDFPDEQEVYPAERYNPFKNLLVLASAIVALVIIGLICREKMTADHLHTEIVAGKGIRKKLKLPDGTIVWLNAESTLRYASDFDQKDVRRVFLIGEAFFDVAHRAAQPFIVRTEKISVKVLGTAFNIQAYPKERKSEATLLRGSIELSVNDRSGQKVILSPSEKFAFVEDRKTSAKQRAGGEQDIKLMINPVRPVKIGQQEYIEETSWKDNQLVFKNESLEELKPRIERWFNVKVRLESPASKSYRFTGVFVKENLNEALTAMQLIKPFNFKLSAHEVTIY